MDISKLSEEQLTIASKVIEEAKKQNVDPDLALAVAFQESKLNPKAVSPKGAVGVMQLMPSTAKELGVNPQNPNQNIVGGITLLKKHLDTYTDPTEALIAYNAGPNHPFFKTGDLSQLSDETINYISNINKIYRLNPEKPEVVETETKVEPVKTEFSESTGATEPQYLTGALAGQAISMAGKSDTGRGILGTAGEKASPSMMDRFKQRFAPRGVSPEQSVGNWRSYMEAQNEAAKRIRRDTEMTKKFPQFTRVTPDVLQKTPIEKVSAPLEKVGRVAGKVPFLGALSGMASAEQMMEAKKRAESEDYVGATISGLGGVGSMLSAVPHPLIRGVGLAVGSASPLALMAYDQYRKRNQ